jgi:hypothetical protein
MKICKYCGKEIKGDCREVCDWCCRRRSKMKRFAKARDELRRKCGLPPLEDNSNDT